LVHGARGARLPPAIFSRPRAGDAARKYCAVFGDMYSFPRSQFFRGALLASERLIEKKMRVSGSSGLASEGWRAARRRHRSATTVGQVRNVWFG
jgi:hypothetical protein